MNVGYLALITTVVICVQVSSVDIQSGLVSVAQNELVSLGVFECLPYQLTDDQVISELKQEG